MERQTLQNAVTVTPTAHLPLPAPLPPAPPEEQETLVASSRSAQLALVVLIALAVGFLGGFAVLNGSLASRPDPILDSRLDLNHATPAEIALLPGIGPKLAGRIDAYRAAHGPFRSADELLNVPGIGPAILQRIRNDITLSDKTPQPLVDMKPTPPRIAAEKSGPVVLDPNSATLAQLDTLPGIGPVLAQRILDERHKKPFVAAEELRRVKGIGPKTLEKIRPFLRFEKVDARAQIESNP